MPETPFAPATQSDGAILETYPLGEPDEHGANAAPIGPVGLPLDRIDGKLKVTGRAQYAYEAPVNGPAFALLIGSTIGAGAIVDIDDSAARSAPGVLAVITPKNMPKLGGRGGIGGELRQPLSDMKIFYAGQYVAVVVADTPERAHDAVKLVKITYAPSDPVLGLDDPRVTVEKPKKNFKGELQGGRGDVEQALKDPSLTVVKQTYDIPVETHNPMEMSATVAQWDGPDRVTVWDATQYVTGVGVAVGKAFNLPPQNVRVLCPYVGGGFGCKGSQWPHIMLAVTAAKIVGRPVRLMLERSQMFTDVGHRPRLRQQITIASDKSGKLAALSHDTIQHSSYVGDYVEPCGLATSAIMYDVANFSMSQTVLKMNVATPTFMRAPGENPGSFALESAMDELSYATSVDPIQLRLINYAEMNLHEKMPWSGKHLRECYSAGADVFGWSKRNPAVGSMKSPEGLPMGWGMATASYPAHRMPGTARIRLYRDGAGGVRAVGAAATQDLGTGMWTVGTQMTAAMTGLPMEKAKFELGDSTFPPSGVSGGSATTASVGQALAEAADALKSALLKYASYSDAAPLAKLEYDQVDLRGDRLVAKDDPSRYENIADLIARSGKQYVEGFSGAAVSKGEPGQAPPPSTRPTRAGGNGEDYNANDKKYAFQSFGAHFVEVTIDQPVPMVRVRRVVSVMDIGRIINPKTTRSQVMGAVVMGIGMALMEETVYDKRDARPINANLADYPMPVNPDVREIVTHFVEYPDTHFNALGCRGVGEIGITGIAAAIANAVYHATGKRVRDLPITPDKLL